MPCVRHFEGVPDDLLVTNYFDKLIQVPIRVPPLGPQEVRAYMMLLFVANSDLDTDTQEKIRARVYTAPSDVARQACGPGLRSVAARAPAGRAGRQVRRGGSSCASNDNRL